MKILPTKVDRDRNFKGNDSFSVKKVVGPALELTLKDIIDWISTY